VKRPRLVGKTRARQNEAMTVTRKGEIRVLKVCDWLTQKTIRTIKQREEGKKREKVGGRREPVSQRNRDKGGRETRTHNPNRQAIRSKLIMEEQKAKTNHEFE